MPDSMQPSSLNSWRCFMPDSMNPSVPDGKETLHA